MANAAAIRAGRAFVEMFIEDESVQRTLNDVKTRFQSFQATMNQTSQRGFVDMSTAAATSAAATTASVAPLIAGALLLQSTVFGVANAFRVGFGIVTRSVSRGALSLFAFGHVLKDIFPANSFARRWFDSFLSQSQVAEKTGRWTRFLGSLTGSAALRNLGNRIERIGLSSAIYGGFQKGIFSGITATAGAAFRSARSALLGGIGSLVTMPFRGAGALLGIGRGAGAAGALAGSSTAYGTLAANLTRANAAAGTFAGTRAVIASVSTAISGALFKLSAFAAAISGPALLAAKSFVSAAKEIADSAKESGKSLESLIQKKFGKSSFIKPEDIKAAAQLDDTMDQLKQAVSAAWAQIGIAALPVLRRITENALGWAQAITAVLARNRQLIGNVINLAVNIGSAAAAAFAAWKAFQTGQMLLPLLTNPLVLFGAALVGVALAFPQVRQAASDTFAFLFPNFGELLTIVQETIGGIQDAMMGGSITAAADVLWAGLNVAWLAGTEQLRNIFRIASNKMAGYWFDLLSGLKQAWAITIDALGSMWTTFQNKFAQGIAYVIAKLTGQDPEEVLKTLREMQQQEAKATDGSLQKRLDAIKAERAEMQKSLDDELHGRQTAAQAELDRARKQFAEERKRAATLRPEVRSAASSFAAAGGLSAGFGSFSSSAVNRIGIGGLSKVEEATQKTAENTEKIAANTAGGFGPVAQ